MAYHATLNSTNDAAKKLARAGAQHGTLVIADTQTAGKGRRGRTWFSPPATGLWFSLILRPNLPPAAVGLLPLLAGVAVTRAIITETGVMARLKWPNDVLVRGKKLCGILLEMSAEANNIRYVVLGIGINVNQQLADLPPELRGIATSLAIETGSLVRRVPLLKKVLLELEERYEAYSQTGSAALMQDVEALSCTIGHQVDVRSADNTVFSGLAVAIENDGALRVRNSAGFEHLLYAGDVSVRRMSTEV